MSAGNVRMPLQGIRLIRFVSIQTLLLYFLALFDVSAAFDSVDHQILLQRLSISFGFSGYILGWRTSFLGALPSWWPIVPLSPGGFLRHLVCPSALFSVPSFILFSLPTQFPCLQLELPSVNPMPTTCRRTSTARRSKPSLLWRRKVVAQIMGGREGLSPPKF